MARTCSIVLAVVGGCCIILGVVALFSFPPIYQNILNSQSSLVPGSAVYDDWVSPNSDPANDATLLAKYYFWNVTNPDGILNDGEKPRVEQVGPLVYRELQEKMNLTPDDANNTLFYIDNMWYLYDETESAISEKDNITVVNLILWTVLYSTPWYANPVVKTRVNTDWNSDDTEKKNAASPFYRVEAGNFLWGTQANLLLKQLGEDPFSPIQFNNSNDGVYEVYTGVGNDNSKRAYIASWDFKPEVPYWGNVYPQNKEYCNMINGTDGSLYQTYVGEQQKLYVFDTTVCRSIYFVLNGTHQDTGDVPTNLYTVPSEVFQVTNETLCYCQEKTAHECLNGVLDVSVCYNEMMSAGQASKTKASVVMTAPNFLYCDQKTIDAIDGMNPDWETGHSAINVEPTSGVLTKARKRLQFNTFLEYVKGVDSLQNFRKDKDKKLLFPVFWVEQAYDPTADSLNQLYDAVVLPFKVVNITCYCLMGLGVCLLGGSLLYAIFSANVKGTLEAINAANSL